ncbi:MULTISPECIES: hypothetical protein [unclassified Moraxella]|uniref:hypothetical protein n=1 Tax=unclassified Moraxella TaxID=2685852 RepID=UPI003AF67C24
MEVFINNDVMTTVLSITLIGNQHHIMQATALSARERQLLLLLGKDDKLSIQGVAKIVSKIDLARLASFGFIRYQYQHSDSLATASVADTANSTILASSKIISRGRLTSFLQTYTQSTTVIDDSAVPSYTRPALPEAVNVDFEDIRIAQALLA